MKEKDTVYTGSFCFIAYYVRGLGTLFDLASLSSELKVLRRESGIEVDLRFEILGSPYSGGFVIK